VDEEYWKALRKRLRTRTSRQMFLIVGPAIVILAVLKILEPMDYPAGDFRNDIAFRLIFYGFFITFAVVGTVASVRWLLADRRK
jgi:hypothetical protein